MNEYRSDDYLAHYGIPGMKWGVRHDPVRAKGRTEAKAGRIKRKIERRDNVAKWATRRGIELDHFPTKGLSKRSYKLARKANKSAIRQVAKGSKFLKAAEKEFKKQNVVSLDKNTIAYGHELTKRMESYSREIEMSVLRASSSQYRP